MRTKPRTSVKRVARKAQSSVEELRQKTFAEFLEQHPPHRVSTNLRRMLLEFLMSEGGIEAEYLGDLLYDLDGLFELLEAWGDEC